MTDQVDCTIATKEDIEALQTALSACCEQGEEGSDDSESSACGATSVVVTSTDCDGNEVVQTFESDSSEDDNSSTNSGSFLDGLLFKDVGDDTSTSYKLGKLLAVLVIVGLVILAISYVVNYFKQRSAEANARRIAALKPAKSSKKDNMMNMLLLTSMMEDE